MTRDACEQSEVRTGSRRRRELLALITGALAYLIATSRPRPSGNAPYPDAERREEAMPPVATGVSGRAGV
ncbi:hypothetical protein [Streptomyces sp. NPDC002962]|uniref:hypothetical protein n=1 Tax=Streptomyces sp. NPDC002962 TaxID=3364674 RepID=UPI0036BA7746